MRTQVFFSILITFLASSYGNILTGSYELLNTILLFDASPDPVGYQIKSDLNVFFKGTNVYKLQLVDPKIHVMSRKAPTPKGFVQHDSNLDKSLNNYFLIEFDNGLIKRIHLDHNESVSMRNLKKSVASLFQFETKVIEDARNETDSSGLCLVKYENDKQGTIVKSKFNCTPKITSDIWGGILMSEKNTIINLQENKISSINATEFYTLTANLADYAVLKLSSSTVIKRKEDASSSESVYSSEVVTQSVTEMNGDFVENSLLLEKPIQTCTPESCPLLTDAILRVKKHLGKLGSSDSADAVYKLVKAFRNSPKDIIYDTLKKKEFKQILPFLIDIAGSGQSDGIHQSVLRILKINTNKIDKDLTERYLWALSVSPTPSINITKEIIDLIKLKHKDEKLFETIILTGSALVKKISLLYNDPNHELVDQIFDELESNLKKCEEKDENCRQLYLKGLSNLENQICLKVFLDYAVNSTKKSSVTAMRAIYKLGQNLWTKEVLKISEHVLLSGKKFDSSSRFVAASILLESNPSEEVLNKIFSLLNHPDRELNQFILEKVNLLSSSCIEMKEKLKRSMKSYLNWGCMAQGGLSTTFKRDFMDGGYLSTDQEIQGGVLKSGGVHVNLIHNQTTLNLFSLGLFSSGLGSFVSSGSQEESQENNEEDEATAGMALQILGVQLRPFVFFKGQGELMGHVWSGTASSKTSAFEGTYLVGLNEINFPLGNGGVFVHLNLTAAVSAELSGLIEISLWNRNAHSNVYNRAGVSLLGGISIGNEYLKSKGEFKLMVEPSLDLVSDIEFGSNVALCLILQQSPSVVRFNSFKVESIEGSKHRLRKTRHSSIPVPGRSYALNRKNNQMCYEIHRS